MEAERRIREVTNSDPAIALLDFEECGLGSTEADRSLRFYGTLRALALQKDAIRTVDRTYLRTSPAIAKAQDGGNVSASGFSPQAILSVQTEHRNERIACGSSSVASVSRRTGSTSSRARKISPSAFP